jgi:hypothetical protein
MMEESVSSSGGGNAFGKKDLVESEFRVLIFLFCFFLMAQQQHKNKGKKVLSLTGRKLK